MKKGQYDVWVISDQTRKWEQHTVQPFTTAEAALGWARYHIPHATYEVRPR